MKRAFGDLVSPSNVIAVTDFPDPDSPTTARISPGWRSNDTPSTASTIALLGRERHVEVVDLEQRPGAAH